MKIIRTLIVITLILLNACGGPLKIYTTHDKNVDFSRYKTFNFYEIKEEHLQLREVNRRRLAMAIEVELGYKGIKRSVNDPDILVNLYSLINLTENTSVTNGGGVGYYGAATPYGTSIGISVSPPKNYSSLHGTGSVTIDLVDRVQNNLILEGVAKIDATESEDADRMINYTVREIFKQIPDAVKR